MAPADVDKAPIAFDAMLSDRPDTVGDSIDLAQKHGLGGGWVVEAKHDPFLLLASAAERKTGLRLGTAVSVAFARTPMLLATAGNDLQLMTGGRFVLGLGTQVRPHIERRFSMPWGKPLARMREIISAVHAIWDSWEDGTRLNHVGAYYSHTLMTPAFSPGPNPHGRPPVYLGALGPAMTELAGECADGLLLPRFVSDGFIREVTLPRVRAGLARRQRALARPFEVVYPAWTVAASSDAGLRSRLAVTRSEIAFYASTPSFRPVLEFHGKGALADRRRLCPARVNGPPWRTSSTTTLWGPW